jgi:hypothetical protein
MASITWGPQLAEVYDETYAAGFEPAVLGPLVGVLAISWRSSPTPPRTWSRTDASS